MFINDFISLEKDEKLLLTKQSNLALKHQHRTIFNFAARSAHMQFNRLILPVWCELSFAGYLFIIFQIIIMMITIIIILLLSSIVLSLLSLCYFLGGGTRYTKQNVWMYLLCLPLHALMLLSGTSVQFGHFFNLIEMKSKKVMMYSLMWFRIFKRIIIADYFGEQNALN